LVLFILGKVGVFLFNDGLCTLDGLIEEFGEEMLVSYDRSMEAAQVASRQAVQRYIQSYRALNGEYPESLEDLQGAVSGHFDPGLYDYDPRTGALTER